MNPIETGIFVWRRADLGYEIVDVEKSELVNYVIDNRDGYALSGGRCILPKSHKRSPVNNILENYPLLFTEFSGLAELGLSEGSIINFADKYGLLLPDYVLHYSHDNLMSGVLKKTGKFPDADGETIDFWHKQIMDMHFALYIWQLYLNEEVPVLQSGITQSPGNIKYHFEFPSYSKMVPLRKYPSSKDTLDFDKAEKGGTLLQAKFYVQVAINEKCKQFPVSPYLLLDKDNNLKQRFRPSSLISLLWFQFFRYVTGEQKVKQCPVCNKWDDVSDEGDKTRWNDRCPKCANRLRVQKTSVKKRYLSGMSIDEIIRRTKKTNPKFIKEWIKEFEEERNK